METKLSQLEPGEKFRHIVTVLHTVNTLPQQNVFDKYGTDTLFDIKMVTTDKHNRKSGLGTELLKRSMEFARVMGFKGCKTEATGRCLQHMRVFSLLKIVFCLI